jgi:hypothetical protein
VKRTKRKSPAQAPGFVLNAWLSSIVNGFLNRVLQSSDSILDFPGDFLGLAFTFKLAVAGRLSGDLLQFAFRLRGAALNAIFVHSVLIVLIVGINMDSTLHNANAFPAAFICDAFNAGQLQSTYAPMPRATYAPMPRVSMNGAGHRRRC